jgi:hypothetical protein
MAGQGRRSTSQTDPYEAPAPRRRIGIWLITGVLVVGAGLGGYAVYRAVSNTVNPQECTVAQAGNSVTLDNIQAANAATIAAVARARGLPQHAVVVAVATARQESKLRNLTGGDRDSIGLFQQRPSMGWGTPEEIGDPVYATGKFYSVLTKVPNWQTIDVGKAAQAVQKSADQGGSSYAQWEPMATLVAAALTGAPDATLTCTPTDAQVTVETPGSTGFTPRADAVGKAVDHAFGANTITTSTGGPKVAPSADGLTASITVPSGSPELQVVYARWAVAHADSLSLDRVAYGDQVWTRSSGKWKTADKPVSGTVDVTVVKGS